MIKTINAWIHQHRFLYASLRALKYKIWSLPVLGKIITDPVELPQMETIGRHTSAGTPARTTGGPRILFFTLRGWSIQVGWDAALAAALRLRGADVQFFTCGKGFPLCDIASCSVSPPMPCDFCANYVERALSAWQFPIKHLRDFITSEEAAALARQVEALDYKQYEQFVVDGVPVGQLVKTSVRWFLSSGTIGDDDLSRRSYKNFLISGAMMVRVGRRLLDAVQPDKLYLLNGLFFAERIMHQLAREKAIPVVTHEVGFMPNTIVFAHNRIAGHFDLDEVWQTYKNIPLTTAEAAQLDEYLLARRRGKRDAAAYYPSIQEDEQKIIEQLALDRSKKIVLMLTNILWDSAVLDRERIFDNMTDWLDTTIRHFIPRQDAQLVIRIHPAEIRLQMHETREKVGNFLKSRFADLPDHIKIIYPESVISSYILMNLSCVGLIYTSTTGLEMALSGKPVIVSGETHYAGKGFTYDPENREAYLELLANLEKFKPMSTAMLESARRYAYLFFFRFMLPFPAITMLPGARLQFNFDTLDALRPGAYPEIDLICDALLNDQPFIRPTGVTE